MEAATTRNPKDESQLLNLNHILSNLIVDSADIWPQSDQLIDIKDFISRECGKLKPEDIVKDPNFDFFEGTHSLEINNEKLDSFLIKLSTEESKFDCNKVYDKNITSNKNNLVQEDYQYVTSIIDRLVRSIISWVSDYQSLPTTILSCCYVEYILTEVTKPGNIASNYSYINTHNPFYDIVLNNSVLGICYFGAYVKKLLKGGGIFEEEDLNFNSMGLEGFDLLPSFLEISRLLDDSIQFVEDSNIVNNEKLHLLNLLKLIKCLIKMETHLVEASTDTEYLKEMIHIVNELDSNLEWNFEPPDGSFSMRIQKTLSNQFPPKTLIIPRKNYTSYIKIANDMLKVIKVTETETIIELVQFANFFNKFGQIHVLARALFSLIVIRDDSSVLGRYSFPETFISHLESFSLASTAALNAYNNGPLNITLDLVSQEALNALFEWYQNNAQNTARYRQGYNRQLLLWDSVQAQFEGLETNFERSEEDKIVGTNGLDDTSLMPFASWAFAMKTTSMIEFVLKGFDLDIYKPFESFSMYWYTFYLTQQLEACLQKIATFIQSKIDSIYAINKKMKKQKAGEKKEKLRSQYHMAMETKMPKLQSNNLFIKYLSKHNDIIKSLCLFQAFQFGLLKSYTIVDNVTPNRGKFVNDRLMHDLRFKPFSSIGVPELPSYDVFQQILKGFIISAPLFSAKLEKGTAFMQEQLNTAKLSINCIMEAIESNDKNGLLLTGTRLVKEEALDYYQRLRKTVRSLSENWGSILNILGDKPNDTFKEKFMVELILKPELSGYFPLMALSDKRIRKHYEKK